MRKDTEKKKTTAAHIRATAKYEKKAYFKALVRFPKAEEERIRAAAGDSLNGYIVQAVREKLERDGIPIPPPAPPDPPGPT